MEATDSRWEAGQDVTIEGGVARPRQGSSFYQGLWYAVVNGQEVRDAFGIKYFWSPEEAEAFLTVAKEEAR